MTTNPEEKDPKVEKGLEDMTAEEIRNAIFDLQCEASDAFRKGRDEEKVARIDAEIEKYHDVFMKLTGRAMGEWGRGSGHSLETMTKEELEEQILDLKNSLPLKQIEDKMTGERMRAEQIRKRMRVYAEAYKQLTGEEWRETQEETEAKD